MVNKARLDDPRFKTLIKQQIRAAWERREQREKDRETIRRLRIQNKKLLARVATLKEQLKKLRADKKSKKRIL
jgi:hypothetical protein